MRLDAKSLRDCGVLVVGGSSGIGFAAARAFVSAGVSRLVVNGRDRGRGEAAWRLLREEAPSLAGGFIAADVTRPEGAEELVRKAIKSLGTAEILVNCAGGDHAPELFHNIDAADIQTVLNHYTMGTFNVSRLLLPHMMEKGDGVIINIASDAAKVPTPGECLNGAAMAAIVMFSRTLALEAKRSGIRVHAVTPSIVRGTRTFDRVMTAGFSARLFEKAISRASLGVVTPEDVASVVVFLAGPDAARITGQVVSVNGGISVA